MRLMLVGAALPDRFDLHSFCHELISDRFEIADNLGPGEIRCFGEACKTKALFSFLHAVVGVQHSSH